MPSPMRGMLMLVTVLMMCCTINSYESDSIRKRNVLRRQRQRQMRRLEALRRHHLSEMQTLESASEWPRLFIPEVPSIEDVDCNIEFDVTQVIGGRCVRLGGAGRLAVCQSGMYLDVHSEECHTILSLRETNGQIPEMSAQQPEQQPHLSQTVSENGVANENSVPQNGVPENGVSLGNNILTESHQADDSSK